MGRRVAMGLLFAFCAALGGVALGGIIGVLIATVGRVAFRMEVRTMYHVLWTCQGVLGSIGLLGGFLEWVAFKGRHWDRLLS